MGVPLLTSAEMKVLNKALADFQPDNDEEAKVADAAYEKLKRLRTKG